MAAHTAARAYGVALRPDFRAHLVPAAAQLVADFLPGSRLPRTLASMKFTAKTSAVCCSLLLFGSLAFAADTPPASQSFALTDPSALVLQGAKADAGEYLGRKAVRLSVSGPDNGGYAIVKGTNFHDGSIDVDLATNPEEPPGGGRPGFVGIAFRIGQDPSHFECFYLRPGNAVADDQARRNHAVQYVSEPHYSWEKLRRTWPFIYEAWADLTPLAWTHVRIDVHGRQAKLFLNSSPKPSLVVDGLKGEDLEGPVALWTYSGEDSWFANLKIENAAPSAVKNGSDAAGTWDVQFLTDAGGLPGTFKLVRQDASIGGFYTGALGPNQQVFGTWRDGYIELTFSGVWPDEPGTVTATLAGWVDGDQAAGRVKVEGRADGRFVATRQKE